MRLVIVFYSLLLLQSCQKMLRQFYFYLAVYYLHLVEVFTAPLHLIQCCTECGRIASGYPTLYARRKALDHKILFQEINSY